MTDTTPGQYRMCDSAQKRIFEENEVFLEMVNSKNNPLTKETLHKLIERFPERWKRFENWLDKLP